jgi:PiT family inorganic phosphate transporter
MAWLVLASALVLAFVNGANDNMKGVATLYGSGQLSYRRALALATASTGLGSLTSVILATALIQAFSGKGLLPAELLTPALLAAVGLGAALTVLLATHLGAPISTTHALVGALVGAGWIAAGPALQLGALGAAFFLPLLFGPVVATGLAWLWLRGGRGASRQLGVGLGDCVCVGAVAQPVAGHAALAAAAPHLSISVGEPHACRRPYTGEVAGLAVDDAVNGAHLLSASAVGFARGLNDTPKILGLAVGASVLEPMAGALVIGLAMAAGGALAARRVTETLAHRLTAMTPGQGLAGNLATSLLVIAASRFGLPVSTTHVSAGGIFGVGLASGGLRQGALAGVLGAWLVTLPLAAALAAGIMIAFERLA